MPFAKGPKQAALSFSSLSLLPKNKQSKQSPDPSDFIKIIPKKLSKAQAASKKLAVSTAKKVVAQQARKAPVSKATPKVSGKDIIKAHILSQMKASKKPLTQKAAAAMALRKRQALALQAKKQQQQALTAKKPLTQKAAAAMALRKRQALALQAKKQQQQALTAKKAVAAAQKAAAKASAVIVPVKSIKKPLLQKAASEMMLRQRQALALQAKKQQQQALTAKKAVVAAQKAAAKSRSLPMKKWSPIVKKASPLLIPGSPVTMIARPEKPPAENLLKKIDQIVALKKAESLAKSSGNEALAKQVKEQAEAVASTVTIQEKSIVKKMAKPLPIKEAKPPAIETPSTIASEEAQAQARMEQITLAEQASIAQQTIQQTQPWHAQALEFAQEHKIKIGIGAAAIVALLVLRSRRSMEPNADASYLKLPAPTTRHFPAGL